MASRATIPILVAAFAVEGSLVADGQGTEQQREARKPDAAACAESTSPTRSVSPHACASPDRALSPACYTVLYPPQTTGPVGRSTEAHSSAAAGHVDGASAADNDDD